MQAEFTLLPWQARALGTSLDLDLVLAGGRGGGKSHCLAALILQLVTMQPGARVLVVRRTFPGLSDFVNLTLSLFTAADSGARYSSQSHTWRFSNGATVELGIMDSEADFIRYQGRSFQLIVVDEAGQYADSRWIDLLRSCLRAAVGQPVRMIVAANPGGVGHWWLFRRFVQPATPWRVLDDDVSGRPVIVIPSTFHDNSHLDAGEYGKQLRAACSGDPELLRAWTAGDWAINRGAFFASVLDESRNLIEPWAKLPHYAGDLADLPAWKQRGLATNRRGLGLGSTLPAWRYFLACDHGTAAPTVVYLVGESPGASVGDRFFPKGSLVLVDELTTADRDNLNTGSGETVPRLAERIKAFCARWAVDPHGTADDGCFARTGSSAGSIADEFAKCGVHFERAHKADRYTGWEVMRRLLEAAGATDQPGLYVSRRCWYFWATVPFIARDPRDPSDCDSRGADHGADSVRYACTFREWETGAGSVRLAWTH